MENMENQPIVENQPVLEMSKPKKFPIIVAVIISVIVTAAIVGGGVYFWQDMQLKSAQENSASAEQALRQQITVLQNQIAQAEEEKNQSVASSDEYVALMDQLKETKFKLAVLDFWQVRPHEVFKDPQDKNKFYYVLNSNSGSGIRVYDFTKDKTYQQNGTFNIPEGGASLFSQKLAEQREFRGAGVVDNKFVFVETGIDDSPGPCFSTWLYSELSYIDLGVANSTRKPYTLSDELKAAETQKVTDCQNSL